MFVSKTIIGFVLGIVATIAFFTIMASQERRREEKYRMKMIKQLQKMQNEKDDENDINE